MYLNHFCCNAASVSQTQQTERKSEIIKKATNSQNTGVNIFPFFSTVHLLRSTVKKMIYFAVHISLE